MTSPHPLRPILVAAALSLFSHAGEAQARSTPSSAAESLPFVVRVGAMRDAAVCLCSRDGLPVPRDRDLYTLTIGTEWPLVGTGAVQLSYAADLIPLVLSRNTGDEGLFIWPCGDRHYCGAADSPYPWRTSAVGAGVLPIGFVLRAWPQSAVSFRARLSGGAVYMSRPVPVMQSRNFNFVAEAGLGAELRLRPGMALSAGITHNHISNANTAPVNLGMDTKLVELGLVLGR